MASSMAIQRASALSTLTSSLIFKLYFPSKFYSIPIRCGHPAKSLCSSALSSQSDPRFYPQNPNPDHWNAATNNYSHPQNANPHLNQSPNPNPDHDQWKRPPPPNPNLNQNQWNSYNPPPPLNPNPNQNEWNSYNPPRPNPHPNANQWSRPSPNHDWNLQLQYQNPNPNQFNRQPQYQNPSPNQFSRQPAAVPQQVAMQQPPPPLLSPVDLLALAQEGKIKEAIDFINQGSAFPDAHSFFNLVGACSDSKSLEDLRKINKFFIGSLFHSDIEINHKIIEMFAKCGSMTDARRTFDRMPERNLDTWHFVIYGYAMNNHGDDELQLFEQMRKLGIRPNSDTFLAVFNACATAEAIEEGLTLSLYGVNL